MRVVYKVTNNINGMLYIGKQSRYTESYLGSGKLILLAIEEFGRESFTKEILAICKDNDEANTLEYFWINFYDSYYPKGYNIIQGGLGGDVFSNNPFRDDLCAKMKASAPDRNGENNNFYGKKHSAETKAKIGEANKKAVHDYENCQCVSCKARRGEGGVNPMKGKHHSEESKKRMSEGHRNKARKAGRKVYAEVTPEIEAQVLSLRESGMFIRVIAETLNIGLNKTRSIINGGK